LDHIGELIDKRWILTKDERAEQAAEIQLKIAWTVGTPRAWKNAKQWRTGTA
jgi:hypothetical protein